MTDRERDAPRPRRDHDADRDPTQRVGSDDADASGADEPPFDDEAAIEDQFEEDDDAFAAEEIGAEADDEVEEASAAALGPTSPRARFGRRLGRGNGATAAPLVTPSERAVRIDDRASQIYVVGVVATFVGILLFAMLWGARGFFTTVPPSPSPSLAVPSGSASPSASALPSAGSSPAPGAASSTIPSTPPSPPSS
jgi:hypothetical protein